MFGKGSTYQLPFFANRLFVERVAVFTLKTNWEVDSDSLKCFHE